MVSLCGLEGLGFIGFRVRTLLLSNWPRSGVLARETTGLHQYLSCNVCLRAKALENRQYEKSIVKMIGWLLVGFRFYPQKNQNNKPQLLSRHGLRDPKGVPQERAGSEKE